MSANEKLHCDKCDIDVDINDPDTVYCYKCKFVGYCKECMHQNNTKYFGPVAEGFNECQKCSHNFWHLTFSRMAYSFEVT